MSTRVRQTLLFGIGALGIGLALILLPIVLPRSYINRFLVLGGFLSICWGVCCLLLSIWSKLFERDR